MVWKGEAEKTCSQGLVEHHQGESARNVEIPDKHTWGCRVHKKDKIQEVELVNLVCVSGNKVKTINLNSELYNHMISSDFVLFETILLSEHHFLPNWH